MDVVAHGEASPYKDWFHIHSFPVSFDPFNFEGFGSTAYITKAKTWGELPSGEEKKHCMPKLNTENPEVIEYLLGAVAKWTRTGIDGWRLDVADEVDAHFWREFRKTVRGINPDAVIIGEDWWNAQPWLRGDQFDGVMNYAVQRSSVLYFAEDRITPYAFEESLTEYLMRYSSQANDSMLNLLDSHDTPRFVNTCGGSVGRLKNAAAFQYTYIGMPCTYYGTEIGMTGDNDPDCRKTFDWNEMNWDHELREYYKKLIALRKTKKALQIGTIRFCSTKHVFAMERTWENERLLVLINNTNAQQEYPLPCTKAVDLLGDKSYAPTEAIELAPYSAAVLELAME